MGIPDYNQTIKPKNRIIIPTDTTIKPTDTTSNTNTQKCGICDRQVGYNPRYKNYVCYDCQRESPPVNIDGDEMEFRNIDAGGGIMYYINGEKYQGDIKYECYIKGVKCSAIDGRFGGIVIQTV